MSSVLTHHSTVYPGVESKDADDVTLQPMLLAIQFFGKLPRHLIEQAIPIEISVSIAEEFGCFAMPIVQTMSLDCWHSLPGSPVNDDFELLSDDSVSPANNIPIPFLPLPSHFNYNKRTDWELLSKLDRKMANRTAFPSFPRGTWHMWDPRIPLEGAFIEQWLETSDDNINVDNNNIFLIRGGDERDAEDLSEIWDALCRDAALFYPYSLIAND
ncbi:uncharacterized protein EDB93DRAFT_1247978 [Suillus bovinus]|uniref:uncharacterized protein n=1 Tax=Suillus bovinus TaxID=48563 RepID=UPI001B8830B6|nr:uncharacterized protein EDB93DRAFT_1247978 [Suillus bovinus]KAG2155022.1 hypothetical protein EDB93DRAFT_1247978 [Suillus bovinus]